MARASKQTNPFTKRVLLIGIAFIISGTVLELLLPWFEIGAILSLFQYQPVQVITIAVVLFVLAGILFERKFY